jgi:hypothetical protein
MHQLDHLPELPHPDSWLHVSVACRVIGLLASWVSPGRFRRSIWAWEHSVSVDQTPSACALVCVPVKERPASWGALQT